MNWFLIMSVCHHLNIPNKFFKIHDQSVVISDVVKRGIVVIQVIRGRSIGDEYYIVSMIECVSERRFNTY